jgi:malate dehydrogenase (oxaloacetate-decarboxylating)
VGGRAVPIGQGNNAFVFPGLGFGAILAEASEITDGMVLAAAYALAEYVARHHLKDDQVYPPVERMREVAAHVATRVVEKAFDDGVARSKKMTREQAGARVRAKMWQPTYLPFEKT